MASKNVMEGFNFTEKAQLGLSCLKAPEPYTNPVTGVKGAPKFNAQFVMDPGSKLFADLKKVCIAVARQKWGNNLEAVFTDKDLDATTKWKLLQLPFKSGDTINKDRVAKGKEMIDHLNGKVQLNASTGADKRPSLALTINGQPKNLRTAAEQEPYLGTHFYNGADVQAMITVSSWQSELGAGVCAYLNGIFSYGTGERLGGSVADPAAQFGGHVGHVTGVDPIGAEPELAVA